jgi:hypothetical protein
LSDTDLFIPTARQGKVYTSDGVITVVIIDVSLSSAGWSHRRFGKRSKRRKNERFLAHAVRSV